MADLMNEIAVKLPDKWKEQFLGTRGEIETGHDTLMPKKKKQWEEDEEKYGRVGES